MYFLDIVPGLLFSRGYLLDIRNIIRINTVVVVFFMIS